MAQENANSKSAIQAHGEVVTEPSERYGDGPVLLRLGNGGAGPTGILRALSTAYLSRNRLPNSITWTQNPTRNTLLALHRHHVDLALSYERSQEILAASEGWSRTLGPAFHDHFLLAGPLSDPAGLASAPNIPEALRRVRSSRALFHSRADSSATMWKERHLWGMAGLEPWSDNDDGDAGRAAWYVCSVHMPAEALKAADPEGAYLLIDRATLLRQTAAGTIANTTVFFEPRAADDVLINSCFGCCRADLRDGDEGGVVGGFWGFVAGEEGQRLVREFGRDEAGLPFFAASGDGFAKETLVGGRPVGGKWVGADEGGVVEGEECLPAGCKTITKEHRTLPTHVPPIDPSKTPFLIYHPSFRRVLGPRPTLTLAAEHPTLPLFHEAGVYIPQDDTLFVTSNQYTPPPSASCSSYPTSAGKTTTLTLLRRDPASKSWSYTHPLPTSHPISLPNGGVNLPRDPTRILLCQQGTLHPTHPPAGLVTLRTSPPYTVEPLLSQYQARPLNSPNDAAPHPRSRHIFFTDPSYGHAQGVRPEPQLPNQVYAFDPSTGAVAVATDGFVKPNGVAFGPGGGTCYVTDTGRVVGDGGEDPALPSHIYAFDVFDGTSGGGYGDVDSTDGDGGSSSGFPALRNRRSFATAESGAPDGIKCDAEGNVWAGCGDGVNVWDAGGSLIGKVLVEGGVANFCFGRGGEVFVLGERRFLVLNVGGWVRGALLEDLGLGV